MIAYTKTLAAFVFRTACFGAIAALLVPAVARADGPLIVPGSFGVGSTGAANYTIPIQVPPGTAGMAPSLSLSYSSQGGNGIVGMGWSLNGLSSIGRCPETIAQDGTTGTVDFTTNDRFCLDGQRLVSIKGAYGADGTEYRTETDSFSRIISHGTLGTGPAWFQVWTKSGQLMQFGDSIQVLATGKSSARTWPVDEISDPLGNYLTVSYQQSTTTGEVYPTGIAYTGNTAAGTTPYNSVVFVYATRPDVVTQYQSGASIWSSQLLTDIQTFNGTGSGAALVLDYKLTYQQGIDSARSRLANVTICQNGGQICVPATNFTWNEGDATLTNNTNVAGNNTLLGYVPLMGDFGGTGRQSIFWVAEDTNGNSQGPTALWLSNGDGTFQQISDPAGTSAYLRGYVPLVGDFNGDGKLDVLWSNGRNRVLWLNNGNGSFSVEADVNGQDGTYLGTPFVADFNGDGLADVIWCQLDGIGSTVAPYVVNGVMQYTACTTWVNTSASSTSWGAGRFASSAQNWTGPGGFVPHIGNFHGSGRADILWITENGNGVATGQIDTWLASQAGTFQDTGVVTPSDSIAGFTPLIGNFGSDSNSGVLWWRDLNGTYSVKVWSGHGDGTFTSVDTPGNLSAIGVGDSPVLGDFDGDGRVDVLWYNVYNGTRVLWLGNGNGTFKSSTNVAGADGQYVQSINAQTGAPYGWSPFVADFVGNGKASVLWDQLDVYQRSQGLTRAVWLSDANPPTDSLAKVTNGITAQVQINYAPIDNYFFYTKGSSAAYPTLDYTGPLYVVDSVNKSDGIGNLDQRAYLYSDAQIDLHGRGFLGFSGISTLDGPTQLFTVQNYNQAYPWTGTTGQTSIYLWKGSFSASPLLSQSYTGYLACVMPGPRYVVQPNVVNSSGKDLDGTTLPSTTASYTYDFTDNSGNCVGTTAYGDVTTVVASTSDGFSQTTANTYGDLINANQWLLGRVTQSVAAKTSGGATITRTSSATYNSSTGLVAQTISEPSTAGTDPIITNYGYDSWGNTTSVSLPAMGGVNSPSTVARTTTTTYDGQGQFVINAFNAAHQKTTYQHDARFGGVTQVTDPNGLISTTAYDGFGRISLVTAADRTQQSYAYALLTPSQNFGLSYSTKVTPYAANGTTQVGPQKTIYYDILGRSLINDVQGFDGSLSRTQVAYDTCGNVAQQSRPFFASGGTAQNTIFTYDIKHRLTKSVAPDGTIATHVYSGLVTTDTNANSQTLTSTRNSQGQVVLVTDALLNPTKYAYDPEGNLKTVTDVANNVVSMTYDLRGHMIGKTDPDVGTWTYVYDVLGELRQTTDNEGQIFSTTYDLLGRPVSRTEPDLTSTWTYDTAANGIGKLATASTNQGYALSLSYDTLTRPIQSAQTIGGQNQSFTVGYDADSRIASIQYPSGFTIAPSYNAYGYASTLSETDTTAPGTLSTVNTMDAEGHLTQNTFGNGIATVRGYNPQNGELKSILAGPSNNVQSLGYSYDLIGNILVRSDATQSLTENFGYDPLNRLTSATLNSNPAVTYGYDTIGNIKTKSDVGTFTYGPSGGAGPHQVQSIDVSSNSPYAAAFAAGTERSYTWTSFNMPATVSEGGKTIAFSYDAGHSRITQSAPEGTTTYLRDPISGATEEMVEAGGTVTQRNYFSGGVSLWTQVNGGAVSATIRYIHGDHLGSSAVLTDPTGAVVERDGYDAWGKRRYANGAADSNGAITSQIDQGYIGQEELPDVSLVHLNARLYDPVTGRFVSADPIGLQGGANIYAYAGNNPVGVSDPSGMSPAITAQRAAYFASVANGTSLGDIRDARQGQDLLDKALADQEADLFGTGWVGASPDDHSDFSSGLVSTGLQQTAQNAITYANVASTPAASGGNGTVSTVTAAAANTTQGVGGSTNNGTGGIDTCGCGVYTPATSSGQSVTYDGNTTTVTAQYTPATTITPNGGAPFSIGDNDIWYNLVKSSFAVARPVGSALLKDDNYVRAAVFYKAKAVQDGTVFVISSSQYMASFLLQSLGQFDGMSGVYEYIVPLNSDFFTGDPILTHQRFIPGGNLSGYPNNFGGRIAPDGTL